jgi:serine/threonine protein phosphatase PrpC
MLIKHESRLTSDGRGGSTALCVVFNRNNTFTVVNLGDSNIARYQ